RARAPVQPTPRRVRPATADPVDAPRQPPIPRGAGAIAVPMSVQRKSPSYACSPVTSGMAMAYRLVAPELTMSNPLLQMSAISKRFPGVVALEGVDFDVSAGEIVALVGENGAGKSTLMKILAGIHRADSGEIRIDGAPIVLHAPGDAARSGIAVIHQELEVIDTLDVAGNVFLGREPRMGGPLRLLDRRTMDAETERQLSRIGVSLAPRTPMRQLATAQQQLVATVRALSMNARLLILDEPTSSLTGSDAERLFHVLRDLRANGTGIVYISHRLKEIETLADRAVVLRDGCNAGMLTREVLTRDRLPPPLGGGRGGR